MNTQEIADIIRESEQVIPIGNRTKLTLSADVLASATVLEMREHSGIVAYDPDEYTVTAKSGTTLAEVVDAVSQHGQYLPFDPLLVASGATLGGVVATNTSGSGRLRYGGVRDFILGVRFVDGLGNIAQGGGKVVKNASGFDLPKFMVGSLGRYGILTEITLKVFPSPAAYQTLQLNFSTLNAALEAIYSLANQPFELDALDFWQPDRTLPDTQCLIRIGGLTDILDERVTRLKTWLQDNTAVSTIDVKVDDAQIWSDLNALQWAADNDTIVKIPVPPRKLLELDQSGAIDKVHYYAAGNGALVTTQDLDALTTDLNRLQLNGLQLRGTNDQPILGNITWRPFAQRIKQALDPKNKFLGI